VWRTNFSGSAVEAREGFGGCCSSPDEVMVIWSNIKEGDVVGFSIDFEGRAYKTY
jgi:hypothetical protein